MGAKGFLTGTVLIAGLAIGVLYLFPELQQKYPKAEFYCKKVLDTISAFSEKVLSFKGNEPSKTVGKKEEGAKATVTADRLFTVEELKSFDGSASSPGLYLAIMGKVFDVSKGAQHYRPGGGYSFFAGRDATKAYVTGDFTEDGLVDSVDGLSDADLLGISDWLNFYNTEYSYVGLLIGRYYNGEGKPTEELLNVMEKIDHALSNKWKAEAEKKIFPPCNSEWSQEKGGRVWCSNRSGGIERDWVGVPRKFYKPGHEESCVCVRTTGPPSDNPGVISHSNKGDLEHPSLKEYPNCPVDSVSCSLNSK